MRRVASAFENRKPNSAPISIRDPEDTFGWYLLLCESLLDHPGDYDFAQGSRVIPLMKALGRHLDLLCQIRGIEGRVQRLATYERRDPDSGIFEILVALCYLRNGWSSVRFVPESPTSKTYDLEVSEKHRSLAVECKRMAKSSQYSIEEREHFQRMWRPLSDYLVRSGIEVSFDIMFHEELDNLPDDFLLGLVRNRVPLLVFSTLLHSNSQVTITAWPTDLSQMRRMLQTDFIKVASSLLMDLVVGYERNKGFVYAGVFKLARENPSYIEDVDFMVSAKWDCDAPEAIDRKARPILDHLAKAVEQLPYSTTGAIHVGIEAMDGDFVEHVRYDRIKRLVAGFNPRGKRLDWIYCHVFVPEVPPRECWAFDETTYPIKIVGVSGDDPLPKKALVLPDSVPLEERPHWYHDGAEWKD